MIKWNNVLVLTSCCATMMLDVGLMYSFGTIFTDIMSTFSSTRAQTSVIQSALISVLMLSGVITGTLIKKCGQMAVGIFGSLLFSLSLMASFFAPSLIFLIITVGVCCGFCLSCIYIGGIELINRQLLGNKLPLYISIHSASAAMGGMVYPSLLRYLSDLYGWRGALLLTGAISLNAVPCCILWKRQYISSSGHNHESDASKLASFQIRMNVKIQINDENISIEKNDDTDVHISDSIFVVNFPVLKGKTCTRSFTVNVPGKKPSITLNEDKTLRYYVKSVLCNKFYMLAVVSTILVMPLLSFIFIFVGDIYEEKGLTSNDVSFALILTNIFNILGRLCVGFIFRSERVSAMIVLMLCSVASAVLFLLFPFVQSRTIIIGLTAMFGFPSGMLPSAIITVAFKQVGSNLLPIAVGIFFTLNGISHLVSGPLNGFFRDVTGSYISIFYTGTAIISLASFIFFVAYRQSQKDKDFRKNSTVFYITNF